jgi:hypothetical protein
MSSVKYKWGIDMEVGDLVIITSNLDQGVGLIVEKNMQPNPVHYLYRILWANGHVTVGGKYHLEVINESR